MLGLYKDYRVNGCKGTLTKKVKAWVWVWFKALSKVWFGKGLVWGLAEGLSFSKFVCARFGSGLNPELSQI